MTYYKVTYESNTIEGLKALQGSFFDPKASATEPTTFETSVPPPPQQDEENVNSFSGVAQPPPTSNATGTSLNSSDENAFYPPPPVVADSVIMDIGLEGEIPPPPKVGLQDQDANDES